MGGGGESDGLTGLLAGGITAGGDILSAALKKLGGVCCQPGAAKGNHTVLCKVLKKFNKNFKCFEKMMSAYEGATSSAESSSGYVGSSSQGKQAPYLDTGRNTFLS